MWQKKISFRFKDHLKNEASREKILLYICDLLLSHGIIINDNEFYIIAAKDLKNLLKDTTWESLLHVDTCLLHEATISAPSSTSSHARILPLRRASEILLFFVSASWESRQYERYTETALWDSFPTISGFFDSKKRFLDPALNLTSILWATLMLRLMKWPNIWTYHKKLFIFLLINLENDRNMLLTQINFVRRIKQNFL